MLPDLSNTCRTSEFREYYMEICHGLGPTSSRSSFRSHSRLACFLGRSTAKHWAGWHFFESSTKQCVLCTVSMSGWTDLALQLFLRTACPPLFIQSGSHASVIRAVCKRPTMRSDQPEEFYLLSLLPPCSSHLDADMQR